MTSATLPYSQAEIASGRRALGRYQADPCAFFREILGIADIHPPMVELAESVRDHKRTAVAGCHDSSKSFCLAALAWWWVCCWPPAKVITTSASGRQVAKGLWAEIRSHHANARRPLGGRLLPQAPEWALDNDTFMLGFTTNEDIGAAGATRFQGFKSPNRLVIMDEAVQIPRGVWQSVNSGLMGGAHPRLVAAANPTDPACEFARCWRPGSAWNTINISAFDLPNLRENRVLFDYLPTPEWVEDQRTEYGEDHPLYQARVLGQFPDEAVTTLISMRDFRAACERKHGNIREERVSIGCDVAREGDDLTVIVVAKGPCIMHVERLAKRLGDEVGDKIHELALRFELDKTQAHYIAVDSSGGWGTSPVDHLRRTYGYMVREENFGSAPEFNPDDPKEKRYRNRRTEIWCHMAEWIRTEACLANLPPLWERWLEDDLPGCLVSYMADQRRDLERKQDMKKRLGHSPDHGDALALALSWRSARRYARMPDAPSSYRTPERQHPDDDPADEDHPDHADFVREERWGRYSVGGVRSPYER